MQNFVEFKYIVSLSVDIGQHLRAKFNEITAPE